MYLDIREQIAKKYPAEVDNGAVEAKRLAGLEASIKQKLDQVQKQYRLLENKPKPKDTDPIRAAKQQLQDAASQMRSQDRIFELERQIREKDFPAKQVKGGFVSPALEKLQTQESILKAQRDLEAAAFERGEHLRLPDVASPLNFFERLHGALHTPVQRYGYTTEATKLTNYLASKGVDVQNPEVVTAISAQAFRKSMEATLMNDNQLTMPLARTSLITA